MRILTLTLGATLALAACGATNVNQDNYERIKAEYAAAHGGSHGDHGEGGGHADGSADAGGDHGGDEGGEAHADGGDAAADAAHGEGERDLANGEKVYGQYCIACHGADGKGMNGLAANFAEDRTRLAKDMDVLVDHVRNGYKGEIGQMPPWGAVVDDPSTRDVIAWLRTKYPPEG